MEKGLIVINIRELKTTKEDNKTIEDLIGEIRIIKQDLTITITITTTITILILVVIGNSEVIKEGIIINFRIEKEVVATIIIITIKIIRITINLEVKIDTKIKTKITKGVIETILEMIGTIEIIGIELIDMIN